MTEFSNGGKNINDRIEKLSRSQQILFALKEARLKIEELERSKTGAVAIIGMGCRFPGGVQDPAGFWKILCDGVDTITEVPAERWDLDSFFDPDPNAPGKMYSRFGGFLQHIDRFDPRFFGISPREAESMDPQQRLLLEVSWETLENAGLAVNRLSGSRTGVFVGLTANDYWLKLLRNLQPGDINVFFATGNAPNSASGRISYALGFQGPAVTIDTACSSSLTALHLACQSLRNHECDLALAGGVNLTLTPETTICLSRARMLAPDGRCKTFDKRADGFVRGEGCGLVLLKRLPDALADKDNILAVIRGSSVNQDGPGSALTVPNGLAQQDLIRRTLAMAKVDAVDIDYVETHGSGTSLGDPIEVRALGSVLCGGRSHDNPLLIGTVKTNIGHLESASGIAGLIKVVLALQHKFIPPHLNFKVPNPEIPWDEFPIKVTSQPTPWPLRGRPGLAGVSAFGSSGTNAHVIVEEAPVRYDHETTAVDYSRPLHLLNLSAKTKDALIEMAGKYREHLTGNPGLSLLDVSFSANTGRRHFPSRLSIRADSPDRVIEELTAFISGADSNGFLCGEVKSDRQPGIVFVFPGHACRCAGMARQLYETHPSFRLDIDKCADILRPHFDVPLLSVLFPGDGTDSFINVAPFSQAAVFSIEYALAHLWRSWGIEPAVVLGQDVGELAAACAAGIFSLEDGLLIVSEYGRSPSAGGFFEIPASFSRNEVKTPIFSSLKPVIIEAGSVPGAEFCRLRLDETANPLPGIDSLVNNGFYLFLEMGPPSILPGPGNGKPRFWASLDRGYNDWSVLLLSLSALYLEGVSVDWGLFDRVYNPKRVPLPTYPFQRQRCWMKEKAGTNTDLKNNPADKVPGGSQGDRVNVENRGKPMGKTAALSIIEKQLQVMSQMISRHSQLINRQLEVLSGRRPAPTSACRGSVVDSCGRPVDTPHQDEEPPHPGEEPSRQDESFDQEAKEERKIPLSGAQRQLWVLAQMSDAGSLAYTEWISLKLTGPFDPGALHKAVETLVERHESLRTLIGSQGDFQVIMPTLQVDVPFLDFSNPGKEEQDRLVAAWFDKEKQRAVDITNGPLFLTYILKLAEKLHLLVIRIHHIITDGWSNGVLLQELGDLYSAGCRGLPCPPGKPMQFREYLKWQEEQCHTGEMLEHEAYWLESLANSIPVLNLPVDRPHPPIKTHRGHKLSGKLETDIYKRITGLSRSMGCTLFMTLMAVYTSLLHRLTGQEDILLGIPVSGRPFKEAERLIGYCTHLLPIRCSIDSPANFPGYLKSLRGVLLNAYKHQGYPFARLIDKFNVQRDLSQSPLITVIFNLDQPLFTPKLFNLEVEIVPPPVHFSAFDLIQNMMDMGDRFLLEWVYNTDLFDNSTIERINGYYITLLEAILADPGQDLFKISLLTDREREQILVEWNNTYRLYPGDMILHRLSRDQADKTPGHVALVYDDRQLTYMDLDTRANRLACYLQDRGVKPGTLVGLCIERSLEMIVGILGILKAGGAYVPMEPDYPGDRLAFMLKDAGISILLARESSGSKFPNTKVDIVDPDKDWGIAADQKEDNPYQGVMARNPAYAIYTSGSTGRPKGVLITHKNAVHSTMARISYYPEKPGGFLLLSSVAFDSSIVGIFWTLSQGGRLVLPFRDQEKDPGEIVKIIERQGVSHLLCLPSLYKLILMEGGPRQFHSLQTVIVAGEACAGELVKMHREKTGDVFLYNEYGPTEASVWCSVYQCRDKEEAALIPLGRPIDNTCIYILGPYLQPVPIGVKGILYIGGAGLARGYLNRPELTAEKFCLRRARGAGTLLRGNLFIKTFIGTPRRGAGPYKSFLLNSPEGRLHLTLNTQHLTLYNTGDVARWLPDGNIEFMGRIDYQVKIRGFRIELGEIEAVLAKHPQVREAVVIAREDNPGDLRLAAYIVPRPGVASLNPGTREFKDRLSLQLRDFLGEELPGYMVPSAFAILEQFPVTPNGKVDRQALPAVDITRPAVKTAYADPRGDLEKTIASIWKKVLNVDKVGIYDNFFDLGGNSFLLLQVRFRFRDTLARDIPVIELFRHPTINALEQYLGQNREEEGSAYFQAVHDRTRKQKEALRRQRQKKEKEMKRMEEE